MALGGGTWVREDKILPGAYINFSSAARASSALSARGVVAVPLSLAWGPENTVITLTGEDVAALCPTLLGYSYSATAMLPVRELFRNAKTVYAYRLGKNAVKAHSVYAKALYGGTRGNDIKVSVVVSIDEAQKFDVTTYVDGAAVETQTVASAAALAANSWVEFEPEATLVATAGTALTGGTDGSAPTGEDYRAFLSAMEGYSFNVLGCPSGDGETVRLFAAYTERMCSESGANFQLVCYRPEKADSASVIGVENQVFSGLPAYGLVYWVAGAQAGCAVSGSLTNRMYDGEVLIDLKYSQGELAAALKAGKFIFHSVNGTPRVLDDINTLLSLTERQGEDFKANQTVRVLNGVANDIAVLFNSRYLGITPNDADGRISLWNDICKILQSYEKVRAIENFEGSDVQVLPGENKRAVLCTIRNLAVVGAMGTLYMNIIVG